MRAAQRKALERLYDRSFDLYQVRAEKQANHSTKMERVLVLSAVPCRVSYSKVESANNSETIANIAQTVTLFCAPEIEILPGSRIVVTKQGATEEFECSGLPAKYESHQEVPLTAADRRA